MKVSYMLLKRIFFILSFCSLLLGCVSPAQIANYSEILDNIWLTEIQTDAPNYHFKVIDANTSDVYFASKIVINKLGIPVINESITNGTIYGTAIAPKPLSKKEWVQVAEKENPRVKKVSNGNMYLAKDPSGYFIDIKIKIRKIYENQTLINITYALRNPTYQSMGFRLPRLAPPSAAIIGSEKFWHELRKTLKQKYNYNPKIRKPKINELPA